MVGQQLFKKRDAHKAAVGKDGGKVDQTPGDILPLFAEQKIVDQDQNSLKPEGQCKAKEQILDRFGGKGDL